MNVRKTVISISMLLGIQGLAMVAPASAATSAPAAAVTQQHAVPITIRNVVIGQGAPKIIVPTTGSTAEEVLAQARAIGSNPDVDIIEYRIDYLNFDTDAAQVAELGKKVAAAANGKPLILTFRTKTEGGSKEITDKEYGDLYMALIKAHFIDILDVEMFRQPSVVREVVAAAHAAGIKVVMSSHDFRKTPPTAEIVSRLREQDKMGADILKIAVMPHNAADVLKLLDATEQIRDQYSRKPLLTMSMGGLGAVSRFSGQVFGSDLTFGMIGEASAPGQVDARALRQVLDTINSAVSGK
ncbi:type I 3-dehydroquinate dehydratase [Burkholderia sp. Ax-1719]|uniref:type I 3-dehydroquinate dehydratase n=1 Tax=Burkholderia sp. Ax-1719 TaxID=2608334 RepID=UPI001420A829|nr:type I 3-dehydroquinate dehydratase [Burkholderia sp. Ax-1719]NIE63004.1 type I 3-dehydroquinate dehydratase [Burkholderia sp. Ax-1719]